MNLSLSVSVASMKRLLPILIGFGKYRNSVTKRNVTQIVTILMRNKRNNTL